MASRSQSCTSGGPTPTPNPITLTLRLTLSLTLTLTLTLALTRWADIYLDLILVGVAFNGGLLLKHAFYLCEPHDNLAYWPEVLDDGSPEGRQLSGLTLTLITLTLTLALALALALTLALALALSLSLSLRLSLSLTLALTRPAAERPRPEEGLRGAVCGRRPRTRVCSAAAERLG